AQEFELTGTHLQLKLFRPSANYGGTVQSSLAYPAFLGNFEGNNRTLGNTLLPVHEKDFNNTFSLLGTAPSSAEEGQREKVPFKRTIFQKRAENFFNTTEIEKLKSRSAGWTIPS